MARIDNLTNFCEDVAESIRVKTGETGKIPASEFDTKIKAIETNEDLTEEFVVYDTELTEQETMLSDVSRTLHSKVSGGNLVKPHIFVQEEEPSVREGIWLKNTTLPYDDIVIDTHAYLPNTWFTNGEFGALPYSLSSMRDSDTKNRGNFAVVGDYLYYFTSMYNSTKWHSYRYNTVDMTFETISSIPTTEQMFGSAVTVVGTDVYFFGGGGSGTRILAFKYDTLTDAYTQLANLPGKRMGMGICAIDNIIYLFGGCVQANAISTQTACYKYHIETNTYEQIADYPTVGYSPYTMYLSAVPIGTNIYIFGGQYSGQYVQGYRIYDTLTNEFSAFTSVSGLYNLYPPAIVGTKVYFPSVANGPIKIFDLTSNTCEDNDVVSPRSYARNGVYFINGKIYCPYDSYLDVLTLEGSVYDKDSVVLIQNENIESWLGTELITLPNVINRLRYKFNDVFYYSTETGLDDTIPTYYGDGTKWVKIKN